MVLQTPMPFDDMQRVAGVSPVARIPLRADGEPQVKAVLDAIEDMEAFRIEPSDVAAYLFAHGRLPTGGTPGAAGVHGDRHAARFASEPM